MPTVEHDPWISWHPVELGQRLRGISKPWCIVGGWALDLWHGYQTRGHADLEFTILREDFGVFRDALGDLNFYTVGNGIVEPLPAGAEPPMEIAQIWCRDVEQQCWRVDMMIESGTPDTWVCKRDPRIVRPRAAIVDMTPDGLPYLKPAGILLLKAKHRRAKDEIDFENAWPKLDATERTWLKSGLEIAHPRHEWIARL